MFEAAAARGGGIAPEMPEAPVQLKPLTAGREAVDDYAALGFLLQAHPVLVLRGTLTKRGAGRSADFDEVRDGARVRVTGLVLVRQWPGSAQGVLFLTVEDETGPSNIIVWSSLIDQHRRVLFAPGIMGIEGQLQREGRVEHIIADRLINLSPALARVGERGAPPGRVDERGVVSRRGSLAGALGIGTKEDLNPDLLIRSQGGITVRPRNFRSASPLLRLDTRRPRHPGWRYEWITDLAIP